MDQQRLFPDPPTADPEPVAGDDEPPADTTGWVTIHLGPGAVLMVTPETYERRRDRTDWLAHWARKVYD